MKPRFVSPPRVLAIDPTSRGIGFVVFEGPSLALDWGVKETRSDKERKSLAVVRDLLDRYQPEVLVLEDTQDADSRRNERIVRLLHLVATESKWIGVKVKRVGVSEVRRLFAPLGAETKHEIARQIAQRLPELSSTLPPYRKPWMSEDPRSSIFDAASFTLTFYHAP